HQTFALSLHDALPISQRRDGGPLLELQRFGAQFPERLPPVSHRVSTDQRVSRLRQAPIPDRAMPPILRLHKSAQCEDDSVWPKLDRKSTRLNSSHLVI